MSTGVRLFPGHRDLTVRGGDRVLVMESEDRFAVGAVRVVTGLATWGGSVVAVRVAREDDPWDTRRVSVATSWAVVDRPVEAGDRVMVLEALAFADRVVGQVGRVVDHTDPVHSSVAVELDVPVTLDAGDGSVRTLRLAAATSWASLPMPGDAPPVTVRWRLLGPDGELELEPGLPGHEAREAARKAGAALFMAVVTTAGWSAVPL